jgi:hypothetical protein
MIIFTLIIHFTYLYIILNNILSEYLITYLKINTYFIVYYSIFKSIFWGFFVHINPVPSHKRYCSPRKTVRIARSPRLRAASVRIVKCTENAVTVTVHVWFSYLSRPTGVFNARREFVSHECSRDVFQSI